MSETKRKVRAPGEVSVQELNRFYGHLGVEEETAKPFQLKDRFQIWSACNPDNADDKFISVKEFEAILQEYTSKLESVKLLVERAEDTVCDTCVDAHQECCSYDLSGCDVQSIFIELKKVLEAVEK